MSDADQTDDAPLDVRIVAGDPTNAEAAAAIAVVRAALEEQVRGHEQERLNATDDWNLSQRALRPAGPFGGATRRGLP